MGIGTERSSSDERSQSLSRVHLLVLELDGVLYAIDTASKNGSWCGKEPVRATRLQSGLRVSLAGKATV